ncbi:MAG: CDP-alcohol phosphatidyltransferase family protein [Candidatus Micrarchaeia archaeon]
MIGIIKSHGLSESISIKVGRFFSFLPFHPNTITFFSVVFAAMGFVFSYFGLLFYAFFSFIFAFLFDFIDGAVARAKKLATKKGAFLDGIADRVVEFFLIIALMLFTLPNIVLPSWLWLISILFFGSCMTAFVKAYAHHKEVLKKNEAEKLGGILERGERGISLLLAFLLVVFNYNFHAALLLILIAILSFVTFVCRVWAVAKKH